MKNTDYAVIAVALGVTVAAVVAVILITPARAERLPSEAVGKWQIHCHRDAMTDRAACFAMVKAEGDRPARRRASLALQRFTDLGWTVVVRPAGVADSRRGVWLRLDDGDVYTTKAWHRGRLALFAPLASKVLLRDMATARTAVVRWSQVAGGRATARFDVRGAGRALERLEARLAELTVEPGPEG